MSKVVPIRGRELVPMLEDWLERARQGEILGLAFAAVIVDETCCEGWAGDVDACTVALYGAVNIMRDAYFHQNIEHYSQADRGWMT